MDSIVEMKYENDTRSLVTTNANYRLVRDSLSENIQSTDHAIACLYFIISIVG